ncbi:sulfite exporter TauE/SafE family protein [Zobellia sp. OII3]|uniref:sulfite exporter TauE/SafE family protein n=1 Tax=Zobellia sp. OII3 TaxID=2034520 RepID=UPI002936D560|nr:sulfite exporter TauE/SafE family protein [Zobellia sp. OII3]
MAPIGWALLYRPPWPLPALRARTCLPIFLFIFGGGRIFGSDFKGKLSGKPFYIAIIAFFFFGIYGRFINAGPGFIIILFLHYVNQMTLVRANATKVAVVLIYTLSALAVFVLNDKVNWKIGLILPIGNGSGVWSACRLSVKRGDGFIIIAFLGAMMVAMFIKLWFFNKG